MKEKRLSNRTSHMLHQYLCITLYFPTNSKAKNYKGKMRNAILGGKVIFPLHKFLLNSEIVF